MTSEWNGRSGECPDEGILVAWLDGALEGRAKRRFARHLEECPQCSERLSALRQRSEEVGAWIRAKDPPIPPKDRLRPRDYATSAGGGSRTRPWWSPPRWAAAAVLVLVLGVAGLPVAGWLADRVQQLRSGSDPTPAAPGGAASSALVTEFRIDGDELVLRFNDPDVAAHLTVVGGVSNGWATLTVPDAEVSLSVGPALVDVAGSRGNDGMYRLELPSGVERVRVQSSGRPDELVRTPRAPGDSVVLRIGGEPGDEGA